MKILILGGTEFVSQAVAVHFIKKGYSVDLLTRGFKKVCFEGYQKHLIVDRHDEKKMKEVLKSSDYDIVIDVSGYTKSDVEIATNCLNTKALKQYIFISSGAVYECCEGILTENLQRGFNKNWGEYGLNKKEAEDHLFKLHKKTGCHITIFRPSYIYGPGNNLYRQTFFLDVVKNQQTIFYPAGDTVVQFVHIQDLIDTIESSFDNENTSGEAYNITHNEHITWLYLLDAIMHTMGQKTSVESVDKNMMSTFNITSTRQFFPYRDVHYVMDTKKLLEHQLHIPKITLETGLKTVIHWYNGYEGHMEDQSMTHLKVLKESRS